MLGSISYQFYYYFSLKALVRLEAVLVQLVFEHSLRLRFKADESNTSAPPAEETASDGASEDETVAESETSSTKGKDQSDSDKEETGEKNLVGRLNTLITVDLDNVGSGRDFMVLGMLLHSDVLAPDQPFPSSSAACSNRSRPRLPVPDLGMEHLRWRGKHDCSHARSRISYSFGGERRKEEAPEGMASEYYHCCCSSWFRQTLAFKL